MFQQLGPKLPAAERSSLAKALDKGSPNDAIAATWELAVLWATSSNLGARPHPIRTRDQKQPDGEVDLKLDRPVMFDVKSLSGDTFSFKVRLDKVTQRIEQLSREIKPALSGTIDLRFHEWNTDRHNPRQPSTIEDPTKVQQFCSELSRFLNDDKIEKATIRIPSVIVVGLEKRAWARPYFDWSCSIPNIMQQVENNQSVYAIERARDQLLPFRSSHYLGLILCDGGNPMFSNPRQYRPNGPAAHEMFQHIVDKSEIDFAFTVGCKDAAAPPTTHASHVISLTASSNDVPTTWVESFMRQDLPIEAQATISAAFRRALKLIPATFRKPYSVKSIMEQDQRWQNKRDPRLNTSWFFQNGVKGMKLSARTLVDLLTGKLGEDAREKLLFGSMSEKLESGKKSIRNVRFESGGDGFDDDYIVIEFEDDQTKRSFSDIAKDISAKGQRED
jgi:hypothetical protein